MSSFRRNRKRFTEDFAFQLTADEFESLRSQIATLDQSENMVTNRPVKLLCFW